MAFRKPGWLMVALVSALMAGCGSKTEASKSNFADAIEDHLEKDGRFCVGKSFKFPVHLENRVFADQCGCNRAFSGSGGRKLAMTLSLRYSSSRYP